jgi:hypothetical protein
MKENLQKKKKKKVIFFEKNKKIIQKIFQKSNFVNIIMQIVDKSMMFDYNLMLWVSPSTQE